MLLRRFMDHVNKQNWFAVGLDLVIVVLGVFIGIQVANWNEELADRKREQQILRNIADDIRHDRAELLAGVNLAGQTIDAANLALGAAGLETVTIVAMPHSDIRALGGSSFAVSEPREFSPEDERKLWSMTVVRYYPTQSDVALAALTAAGDLSLIRDADLVRELQLYRQLWRGLQEGQDLTYRRLRDAVLFAGQDSGLSPFTELAPEQFAALLAENVKLASSVRTLLEFTVLQKQQLASLDAKAAELLEILESGIAPQ